MYRHTQNAPLYLVQVAVGLVFLAVSFWIDEPLAQTGFAGLALVVLLLAACFQRLTVRDEGDRLRIAFGPIPLFQRSIAYADIERAERCRSSWFDGWGIHFRPGGGWTWNLWGFDCVDVHYGAGRKIRIGTDDPDGLEQFLSERIAAGR